MGSDSSTSKDRDLPDAAGESQGGGEGDHLDGMNFMRETMLQRMSEFLGSAAIEDDHGWSQIVYKAGWGEGFQAGLRYAISITERQGRGWGLQHAEEIRRHDQGREKTSW